MALIEGTALPAALRAAHARREEIGMNHHARALMSALGASFAIGCGGDPGQTFTDADVSDAAAPMADAATEPDAADVDLCATTPTYEELRDTIFAPRCTTGRCHGGTDGPLPQRGPSDFTETSTRTAMVDRASVWRMGLVLVRPGDPDGSFLLAKLTNDLPADARLQGVAMPAATDIRWAQIPDEELASIRCWILAGAP
jgi:hypothetical protein